MRQSFHLRVSVCVHEAVAIIPEINQPHPGEFVSDKQHLATLKPSLGCAKSATFDAVGRV